MSGNVQTYGCPRSRSHGCVTGTHAHDAWPEDSHTDLKEQEAHKLNFAVEGDPTNGHAGGLNLCSLHAQTLSPQKANKATVTLDHTVDHT